MRCTASDSAASDSAAVAGALRVPSAKLQHSRYFAERADGTWIVPATLITNEVSKPRAVRSAARLQRLRRLVTSLPSQVSRAGLGLLNYPLALDFRLVADGELK